MHPVREFIKKHRYLFKKDKGFLQIYMGAYGPHAFPFWGAVYNKVNNAQ